MADFNFNFLKFGYSDKQVSLDNFAGEIKKEDIKDKKLLKLFDFFDTDKSGALEANEVKSLWNNIVSKATQNGNSIFEKNEAKSFIEETVSNRGESLQSLGVNFKDIFNFLNAINDKKNKNADINNPDTWDIIPPPAGYEDTPIEKAGYNELENLLNNTSDGFINYLHTEGCISHFINAIRTGKKHAKREDVEADLTKITKALEFLRAAYEGRLMCGDKKITFETAYKSLLGVDYSEKNIEDCNNKAEKYTRADSVNTMVNTLIDELNIYSKYRGTSDSVDLTHQAKFNKSFLTLFSQLLNIQDQSQINSYLKEFCEKYKDNPVMKKYGKKIQLVKLGDKEKQYYRQEYALLRETSSEEWEPLTPEQMQLLANYTINEKLVPVKSALLGLSADATNKDCENYVAQCKKDYEKSFKTAYGTEELSTLLNDYIQGQQTGMQVVNIASAVAMMTATIFTGGGASAVLTGLMISQPIELMERLTDGNGATWKDIEKHGYQVLKSLPWMALGMAAGKLGDMARAACKLKGLQTVASKTGKTLDEIIKEIGANKLGADAVKLLKQANKIAQATGFATEVSIDLVTTKLFQKEGLTTSDWIMSFVGALQGTVMQKKLAGMANKNAQIDYIQKQFKGSLDLTADEAKMIIDKMVNTNNLPFILDEVVVSASKDVEQKQGSDSYAIKAEDTRSSTNTYFDHNKNLDIVRKIFEQSPMRNNPKKELFINEMVRLAEKYPEIPSEKIYNLLNNKYLGMGFDKEGKCTINEFEDILNMIQNYPKYQEGLLDIIVKQELNLYQVYKILTPDLLKIADVIGIDNAIILKEKGITNIGKENFDVLNRVLHGEEPLELKNVREEFKNKNGVDLKFDNDVTPKMAKKYADAVEKFLVRYKEAGKKYPTEILITKLVPYGTNGVAHAHKYPDLICVKPSNNDEWFSHCLFHESVHLTDMINKRRDLQYMPVGTKLGVVEGEIKPVYNEAEAKMLTQLISKYISKYATTDTNEFTAEFGAMLLENKIVIKETVLENGDIVNEIHINEPFINGDGKQVEVTDNLKRDLEKIVDYYFSIGGQNYRGSG